jgi:hypothetical protein
MSSGPPDPAALANLPHEDESGKTLAIVWFLSAFSLVFLSLRLYCKYLVRNGWWWDEYFLVASWVYQLPLYLDSPCVDIY